MHVRELQVFRVVQVDVGVPGRVEDQRPPAPECPECGEPLKERWGRFGKFIACSAYPECKNKKNLPGNERPEADWGEHFEAESEPEGEAEGTEPARQAAG